MIAGITYDLRDHYRALGFKEEDVAEFDSETTIDAIDNTLKQLGFETERIGAVTQLVEQLAAGKRWDFIFNIAEGVYGIGREAQVPAVCDAYRIPYTFSDPCVLALTLNKELTKRVIRDLGLATPDFKLVHSENDLKNIHMEYPLFAKPYAEGTGKGINALSVIKDRETLAKVCSDLLEKYKQPVLIESYLSGREFTVGILGSGKDARAIGVLEVLLKENAEDGVYSYMNKENCEDFVIYNLADDETADESAELALAAWRGLGCFDAGRVDVRCDSKGIPNFIEVNPLAGIHPDHSDLPILCSKSGVAYIDLIGYIANSALRRCGLIDKAPDKVKQIALPEKLIPGKNYTAVNTDREKIVILHQYVPADAEEDEKDVLIEAEEISAYILELGYEPVKIAVTLDLDYLKRKLMRLKPLMVFNLVESVDGSDNLAVFLPALLDSLKIKYTGSKSDSMTMTGNKLVAKRLMMHAGIPTPSYFLLPADNGVNIPKGDYIVKSVVDHASIGIDEDSIVRITGKDDTGKLKKIAAKYKTDSFAEQFINGREFNVSILEGPDGPEVMPVAEIVFNNYPEGKPKIVGYRAKWDSGSFEYNNTPRNYDFESSDSVLLRFIESCARKCWDIFKLKGYGRVDFRVDKNGTPWVLEVNANPCLSSDAGFMAAARRMGLSGSEVVKRIMSINQEKRNEYVQNQKNI
ncbi:MAG: hypothetical protein JW864_00290 [Spirochaetes bacterium]|nr:hypothetical protein [Spirochaetota bacterium]